MNEQYPPDWDFLNGKMRQHLSVGRFLFPALLRHS